MKYLVAIQASAFQTVEVEADSSAEAEARVNSQLGDWWNPNDLAGTSLSGPFTAFAEPDFGRLA